MIKRIGNVESSVLGFDYSVRLRPKRFRLSNNIGRNPDNSSTTEIDHGLNIKGTKHFMRALGFVKVGKNRFVCSIVGEITLFRTTVQTEQRRSERMSGVEVLRCILYVDDTV